MNDPVKPRSPAALCIGFAISFVACFATAAIGSLATSTSVETWYADLHKPSWNPPSWIFAPVWTTLYLMMSIAAWLVWKNSRLEDSRLALGFFALQLVLNALWSILFFGLHQPGWALVEIILLWGSIVITMVLFCRHSWLSALLLLPYLLWVTFASALNFALWSLNRIT